MIFGTLGKPLLQPPRPATATLLTSPLLPSMRIWGPVTTLDMDFSPLPGLFLSFLLGLIEGIRIGLNSINLFTPRWAEGGGPQFPVSP